MISDMEKLEAIEKAILDLQLGKRVTSVQYGDTRVQYAEVDLDKLLQIQSQIKANLRGAKNRQIHFTTSKGLR